MTKLLNRIALFLSFLVGTSTALTFGLFVGIGMGNRYNSPDELAMFTVVVGIIIGVFVKAKFLSESTIRETVLDYADKVVQMAMEKLSDGTVVPKAGKQAAVVNEVKQ
jgi:hypothetical protein